VLIEWGERDRFVSKEEAETIFINLSSKNKKLAVYPDAGHESFLQKDSFTWEKEVQAFLKSAQ
jgi:alpha-beta hydrolase superfamily lysophospholipase